MVPADMRAGRILVLDFGSQYTRLIARRVREAGVYSEIRSFDVGEEAIVAFRPRGIVLSGGPESVTDRGGPPIPEAVFAARVPVLGICYGMQAMAARFGGAVEPADAREFGMAEVRARGHSDLLRGIEDRTGPGGEGLLDVWMSHGDRWPPCRRGSAPSPPARTRPSPGSRTPRAGSTASSSIPRSPIPVGGRRSSNAS